VSALQATAWCALLAGLIALLLAGGVAWTGRRRHLGLRRLLLGGRDLLELPGHYLHARHVRPFRRLVGVGLALLAGGGFLFLAELLRRLARR